MHFSTLRLRLRLSAFQHFSLVLSSTYPGCEGGVEALREDHSPMEALTFPGYS